MNLMLFEPGELDSPLPRTDRRAVHLLDVLRRTVGDTFDAGVINGPRGKAKLTASNAATLSLEFTPTVAADSGEPITLIVGLPRPQTARDILRDATTLGVAALHFVRTDKADPNYAQSALWASGEWRRHAIAGAEQAFSTHVPQVTHGHSLAKAIASVAGAASGQVRRLALDNYEAAGALGAGSILRDERIVLAIGAERGWSGSERDTLRAAGFTLVHLGPRVLRTETACTAALAILRGKMGLM